MKRLILTLLALLGLAPLFEPVGAAIAGEWWPTDADMEQLAAYKAEK